MEKKSKVLRKLFFSTLYLSTFTFGGGYVIVTLMKNKFVDELHWIDEEEMLDLVAIAQSSPGAIAVTLTSTGAPAAFAFSDGANELTKGTTVAAPATPSTYRPLAFWKFFTAVATAVVYLLVTVPV